MILGAGPEIEFIVRNIQFTEISLIGYGPYSEGAKKNELHNYCIKNGIVLIEDHFAAIALKPRFVLMLSYAPLISKEALQQCDFVNVHGALLPRYRGMHGGTWALINGEEKAGYTIHLVDEGIDSGPIYFQNSVEVEIEDDINTVREKILNELKRNILKQLEAIYLNEAAPISQDELKAIHVCKRHPDDSCIDWNWSSKRIHDFVRALAPPYTTGAFTMLRGQKLYIVATEYIALPEYYGIPGQVVNIFEDGSILVKSGDSAIKIFKVMWQGKYEKPSNVFSKVGYRL